MIKDMNETTLQYLPDVCVLSDTPEDETTDYYNVTDFYRMRYAQSRVMLLDFDRNTQELYDGKHTELTSKGINLGVVAKDVQYQSNKSSDIVAFVQEGELWSYNRSANKTTQIFSFGVAIWMSGRTCRNMELRSSGWKNPEILILLYTAI